MAIAKQVTKLDYKILAQDIGAPGAEAARLRWYRFQKKLGSAKPQSPSKPAGIHKTASPNKNSKKSRSDDVVKMHRKAPATTAEEEMDTPITLLPPRKLAAKKTRMLKFK